MPIAVLGLAAEPILAGVLGTKLVEVDLCIPKKVFLLVIYSLRKMVRPQY